MKFPLTTPTVGEGTFLPPSLGCLGWPTNSIDMRQISRGKSNLISYIWSLHKNMRPKDIPAIEAYMLYRTKGKGTEAWDFKRQESNLQEVGKSRCLPCHGETKGHREKFE